MPSHEEIRKNLFMQSSIVSFVNELANQCKEEELKSFLRGIASFVKHVDLEIVRSHLQAIVEIAKRHEGESLSEFMESLRTASKSGNTGEVVNVLRMYGIQVKKIEKTERKPLKEDKPVKLEGERIEVGVSNV